MDEVAAVEDLKVANQGISNKTKIWISSKIILVVTEDSLEARGAKEFKASKGIKVILYVIIV